MPFREEISYILVHDEMPEHDKIEPLSDAAFRFLVETWCYCSRKENDGVIPEAAWKKRGTPKLRGDLEDAGLVEQRQDGKYEIHDYLDIQRSSVEIEKARAAKSEGGKLGNHRRHHVNKRIVSPGCNYCLKGVA